MYYAGRAAEGYRLHLKELGKIIGSAQEWVLGGRTEKDFQRARYGLLVWIYEPALEQPIYEAVRDLLADIHALRTVVGR